MVFLVDLCFFRMENLALTSTRTQMYWERRSTSSYASILLYKCCYICVQDSISGALSISRQVHNMENLGQTSGDYPVYRQNLGWSRKSKIPDRLGFSRHMKNRLYPIYRQNLGWSAKRKIPDRLRIFRHTKKQSLLQWVHFTHGGTIDLASDYYYFFYFFLSYGMDKLGKIPQLRRKECIQINKIAKFESDLLKTYEDRAPQSLVGPTIQTSEL